MAGIPLPESSEENLIYIHSVLGCAEWSNQKKLSQIWWCVHRYMVLKVSCQQDRPAKHQRFGAGKVKKISGCIPIAMAFLGVSWSRLRNSPGPQAIAKDRHPEIFLILPAQNRWRLAGRFCQEHDDKVERLEGQIRDMQLQVRDMQLQIGVEDVLRDRLKDEQRVADENLQVGLEAQKKVVELEAQLRNIVPLVILGWGLYTLTPVGGPGWQAEGSDKSVHMQMQNYGLLGGCSSSICTCTHHPLPPALLLGRPTNGWVYTPSR